MDFDRGRLADEILALRAKLGRRPGRDLNEANTKASLIEPLIRALGWDTTDTEEVHREFHHKKKDNPVDYALKLDGDALLLIEAKAAGIDIDGDRGATRQLLSYASEAGVQWAMLTNGIDCRIYNTGAVVPIEDKLFRAVSVASTPVDEIVATLSFLAKPDLAKRRIDRAWLSHHVDRLVREGLRRLFDNQNPSAQVVRLLVVGSRGKLKAKDVQASLRRANCTVVGARFTAEFPQLPEVESAVTSDRSKTTAAQKTWSTRRAREGGVQSGARQAAGTEVGPPGSKLRRVVAQRPRASIDELVKSGALKPATALFARCRGHEISATIEADGSVVYKGVRYGSPSSAGAAARAPFYKGVLESESGPATNGWAFWKIKAADGKLVTLDAFARSDR